MRNDVSSNSSIEGRTIAPASREGGVEVKLRKLDSSDVAAYREVRLTALRDHPDAFAASYDDELARRESETASRLVARPDQVTVGAFDGARLVGVGTLVRFGGAKELHKARVVGMFVSPEARGRGTGKVILEHLITLLATRERAVK